MKRALWVVLVSAAATAAIGYASRAPFRPAGADTSWLRLSWRWRGEKLQTCRTRTQEELDELPVHMRTPQDCTTRLVSYALIVRIDDAPADTIVFAPAGAKGDRPIFVLHDAGLAPGHHRVRVSFAPIDHGKPPLTYDETMVMEPGERVLLTVADSRIVRRN